MTTPTDFTGSAVGSSEEKTKAILKSAMGKVLVIDEAYQLDSGSHAHGSDKSGFHKKAVSISPRTLKLSP